MARIARVAEDFVLHVDERLANDHPLALRIDHSPQLAHEAIRCIDCLEAAEVQCVERTFDFGCLAVTHEAGVHIHPLDRPGTDGPRRQGVGDRGVNAAA